MRKTYMKRRDIINAGDLTKKDILALKRAATHCHYCLLPFGRARGKSTDHVTPLCRGGRHVASNIVICCKPCNATKWSKPISEWVTEMGDKLVPKWRIVRVSS